MLGAIGFANMWAAIFADVGVMILAVLNAVRAMFVPKSVLHANENSRSLSNVAAA